MATSAPRRALAALSVPRSGSSGSQRTRVCCAPRHSPRLTSRLLACHQNCLREIRSSLEKDKPIVLVQEADPAKGGATLQALRGECPEDLQPDIFEKGWAHTTYMRVEEFQRVSLKTIVEAQRDTEPAAVLSPPPETFSPAPLNHRRCSSARPTT